MISTCLLVQKSLAHRSVWSRKRWRSRWAGWGGGVGHCGNWKVLLDWL